MNHFTIPAEDRRHEVTRIAGDLAQAGLEVVWEPPATFEVRVNLALPTRRVLVHKAGITAD